MVIVFYWQVWLKSSQTTIRSLIQKPKSITVGMVRNSTQLTLQLKPFTWVFWEPRKVFTIYKWVYQQMKMPHKVSQNWSVINYCLLLCLHSLMKITFCCHILLIAFLTRWLFLQPQHVSFTPTNCLSPTHHADNCPLNWHKKQCTWKYTGNKSIKPHQIKKISSSWFMFTQAVITCSNTLPF